MRLSCNGCRVLRKGCTDGCTIRPCLQWIKTPEAQANATVFLAKFYGRAGLLNLLAASPSADPELRPAVFRSLLYEACGRVVNPVYGAVGLLWSGTWHMCQAAVEAVLKGAPIVVDQLQDEQAAAQHQLLQHQQQHPIILPNYDIRHVAKHAPADAAAAAAAAAPREAIHKVAKPGRTRFKRRASSSSSSSCNTNNNNNKKKAAAAAPPPHHTMIMMMSSNNNNEKAASPEIPANNEHDEQHQHQHQHAAAIPSSSQCHASSDDDDHHHHHHQQQPSLDNSTDAEAGSSHVTTVAPSDDDEHDQQEHQQLGLNLTLGFFASAATAPPPPVLQTHHTPATAAAADDDDEPEPEPEPRLLLGFRFL